MHSLQALRRSEIVQELDLLQHVRQGRECLEVGVVGYFELGVGDGVHQLLLLLVVQVTLWDVVIRNCPSVLVLVISSAQISFFLVFVGDSVYR